MTRLEACETNVGTVIIKSYALIGTVSVKGATVSVRCKEDTDTSTGRKESGIAVVITESDRPAETMLIDYDDLDSLLNAIDYLSKIDWSVTSLNGFDAVYTTTDGLRIAAFGSKRLGEIQFALRSVRLKFAPVRLSQTELAEFRNLIQQAKTKLESIRKEK